MKLTTTNYRNSRWKAIVPSSGGRYDVDVTGNGHFSCEAAFFLPC